MAVVKFVIYMKIYLMSDESCYYFLQYRHRTITIVSLISHLLKASVSILTCIVFLGEILDD